MSSSSTPDPGTRPHEVNTTTDRAGDEKADDSQQQPDSHDALDTERKMTGIKWAIFIASLISSTFLYAFDNTAVANVRPSIALSPVYLSSVANIVTKLAGPKQKDYRLAT
ncbi:hypothetical protein F4808DRAFT_191534 [Astrocystis sublimbata]|nr:hypothetical protein F4808DRAFT_191534 [Astrocystis sublimbata]